MTYVNPASVVAVAVLFPALAAILLGLRYYFRASKKQELGLDDLSGGFAALFVLACSVVLIVGAARHIFGYHTAPPETQAELEAYKAAAIYLEKARPQPSLEFAFTIPQTLALGTTKISILFFFLRIFRGRPFIASTWMLIILSSIWTLVWVLLAIFPCGKHIDYQWSIPQSLGGACLPFTSIFVAHAVTDVALDLALFALPVPLTIQLHMTWKQKIPIITVFALGAFSIAAGLTRLAIVIQAEIMQNSAALRIDPNDSLGINSLIYFWSYLEIGVALLVSCLMAVGPVTNTAAAWRFVARKLSSSQSIRSLKLKLQRSDGKVAGSSGASGKAEKGAAVAVAETGQERRGERPSDDASLLRRLENGSGTDRGDVHAGL